MVETRGKRAIVILSSSSSEEEFDDHDTEDSMSEYEDDEEEQDDDDGDENSDSSDDDDDDHGDENSFSNDDYDDDDGDENSDSSDDESLSNKVVALLQEGNDLESLKLKECKAYLRKHGLRLAGNRAVCIKRIREHWRIKDGHGYALYPRSSFTIDCTGDVCKGDVVLFRQKVYEKFDKVTRRGRDMGKRTVAGRVVKESYGAAKQQHTFTVEVIWSSGVKKLPPLFPLLVKGRNLYKLKTYRQRWKSEADRVKVLSEKHQRGAKARLVRAMRQKKKKCNADGCLKGQREIQHTRPSKLIRSCKMEKVRHLDGHGRAISDHQPQETTSSRQAKRKQNASSRTFRSTRGCDNSAEGYQVPVYSLCTNFPQSFYQSQVNSQRRTEACYERGFTSSRIEFPPLRPYFDENVLSRSRNLASGATGHDAYRNPRYNSEIKNLYAENVDRPLYSFPKRTKTYGWRNHGL